MLPPIGAVPQLPGAADFFAFMALVSNPEAAKQRADELLSLTKQAEEAVKQAHADVEKAQDERRGVIASITAAEEEALNTVHAEKQKALEEISAQRAQLIVDREEFDEYKAREAHKLREQEAVVQEAAAAVRRSEEALTAREQALAEREKSLEERMTKFNALAAAIAS